MTANKVYKCNVSVPLEIELIEEVDTISAEQRSSRAAYIRSAIKERVERDKNSKI